MCVSVSSKIVIFDIGGEIDASSKISTDLNINYNEVTTQLF